MMVWWAGLAIHMVHPYLLISITYGPLSTVRNDPCVKSMEQTLGRVEWNPQIPPSIKQWKLEYHTKTSNSALEVNQEWGTKIYKHMEEKKKIVDEKRKEMGRKHGFRSFVLGSTSQLVLSPQKFELLCIKYFYCAYLYIRIISMFQWLTFTALKASKRLKKLVYPAAWRLEFSRHPILN